MKIQQIGIEEQIEIDRVDNLYQRSKTASLTLLGISAVYTAVLASQFSFKALAVWYSLLLLVLLGRWVMFRLYFSNYKQKRPLRFWLYLFRLGVFAAGTTIGTLNVFFFTQEPLSFLLMAIIFPYGIAVGAVTMLLDVWSFSLYAVTLLSPIVYQMILAGERSYSGTAVLTIILGFFLLKFSRSYNSTFVTNMRLRYENKSLLNDLQEERNKLNNRLGRILNDNTTEIYVADAESLICLQVNQGAVDQLGYSKEEFGKISLLDIFSELDRAMLTDLLAPLYNGRWEPIKYKGINRRKDGSTYPVEVSLQLSTVDVPPIIVANVQDITERVKWEEKLMFQANYDQLTGIFNRHYIQSYMQSVFTRAKRHKKKVVLLFLDLDHFKDINDTMGHDFGDEVLRQTTVRISAQLRESDIVARTGGDEFTIFLEDIEEKNHAEIVVRKLIDSFQQPFTIKDREIYTTVSVGISIFPDDGETHDQLMQCADMAMYQAKKDGRNTFHFFSREMRRISEEQMLISNHLRYALQKNELSLVYQPKIDVVKGKIVGAEALLRWHNNHLGEISPTVFVPLAENLGLISGFGSWVLKQACQEAKSWQKLSREDLRISVNVSPQQFRGGSLMTDVKNALASSGLDCRKLELEITESLLMQDSDNPLLLLNELTDMGIKIALDDFGTGYSSLSYVRRFPLQVLKIDRSFIHDLETDHSNKVLVDAIIAMAQSLELEIVAEGVENDKQVEYLRQRGVKIIQGYIFSPPVPADKFHQLLELY